MSTCHRQWPAGAGATFLNGSGAATRAPAALRPLFELLSPAGARGRLTILIFHRVHQEPDTLFPDEMHAAAFRERMTWLRTWFNVLPLEVAVTALSRGCLPARALAITFDDGYADNAAVALPILRQLGLHATFFIATGFLDGGRMWNDTVIEAVRGAKLSVLDLSAVGLGAHRIETPEERRDAIHAILRGLKYLPAAARQERADAIAASVRVELPDDLMMTTQDLRNLAAAGMAIGSHTVSHPILARLDAASARREMADGRDALEAIVRQPVMLFAYPNGKPGTDYTAAHVQIARELGMSAAVSTARGAARGGDSVHELPRFTPWDRTPSRWGWRLAGNFFTGRARTG